MAKPIQALAPGFQGILGIKNMGSLPSEQFDTVQPIIDMQPFYLQGRRRTVSINSSAVNGASLGTVATATPVAVPANKVWYTLGGTMRLNIASAQVLSISAKLAALVGTGVIILSEDVAVGAPNVAATAALGAGVNIFARVFPGIILQGGDTLAYLVDWSNGAGAGSVVLDLVFSEFDA